MTETSLRDGACHCGAVRFTVKLMPEIAPRRCNCSLCRMRGAVVVSARYGDLTITQGDEHLRTYQFNTRTAEHHFCGVCGIYTHHRRRSNPNEIGVNVACLGASPFDFACVPVNEGRVHPSDHTGGPRSGIAGYLRYEEAEPKAR